MMRKTGSINLPKSSGRPRTIRIKAAIYKVQRKEEKSNVSSGKLALELSIAWRSVQRILREDLGYSSYKYFIEPALIEKHKIKKKKFANWIRTNFRKHDTR